MASVFPDIFLGDQHPQPCLLFYIIPFFFEIFQGFDSQPCCMLVWNGSMGCPILNRRDSVVFSHFVR